MLQKQGPPKAGGLGGLFLGLLSALDLLTHKATKLLLGGSGGFQVGDNVRVLVAVKAEAD